jgi:hypothetical protein
VEISIGRWLWKVGVGVEYFRLPYHGQSYQEQEQQLQWWMGGQGGVEMLGALFHWEEDQGRLGQKMHRGHFYREGGVKCRFGGKRFQQLAIEQGRRRMRGTLIHRLLLCLARRQQQLVQKM